MFEADIVPAGSAPQLRTRLSLMMFLQYGIWGAWLPILYPFLLGHRQFELTQVGAVLAGGAAGAIVGPFIAGQVADRYFATEKFLAVSHLAGAVLVWLLAGVSDFVPFLVLSVVYGIVYAPTLALTNSLSFHHLPNRDKDFGKVRVWGTIGWIAAGIAMGHWLATQHSPAGMTGDELAAAQNAGRADAFRLSAILGVVMGLYCFTLPHTPPARKAGEKNAWLGAMREASRQPLITLFLIAIPISVIHQFYFVHAAGFLTELQARGGDTKLADAINRVLGVGGGGLMTIGQMTEIAVMALMPIIAPRIGRKWLLGIGIMAYTLRMLLFAFLPQIAAAAGVPEIGVAVAGVALHGLCFGCFIFVSFMIVDEQTTPDVRASAQNLFNLVIVGIGIIVGSWFATSVVADWANGPGDGPMDYRKLFSVPMLMALACGSILLLAYPGKVKKVEPPREG